MIDDGTYTTECPACTDHYHCAGCGTILSLLHAGLCLDCETDSRDALNW